MFNSVVQVILARGICNLFLKKENDCQNLRRASDDKGSNYDVVPQNICMAFPKSGFAKVFIIDRSESRRGKGSNLCLRKTSSF